MVGLEASAHPTKTRRLANGGPRSLGTPHINTPTGKWWASKTRPTLQNQDQVHSTSAGLYTWSLYLSQSAGKRLHSARRLTVNMPFWLTKLLVRTRLARFTPRARRLTDGGSSFLHYYSDQVLAAPIEDLLDPAIVPDPAGPDIIDL